MKSSQLDVAEWWGWINNHELRAILSLFLSSPPISRVADLCFLPVKPLHNTHRKRYHRVNQHPSPSQGFWKGRARGCRPVSTPMKESCSWQVFSKIPKPDLKYLQMVT